MTLRIGRYTFPYVTYDAASDVVYASLQPDPGTRTEPTPENHRLLYNEDGKLTGLALMEPRERLDRDGSVWISLPGGEYERVAGLEHAMAPPGNPEK